MKSRVLGLLLPDGPQHAVADAEHALHALQLFGGQRLVDALGAEVEVQPFRQQRQRVDLQRQLLDQRHLVFGFGLGGAAYRRDQIAEEHLVGIAARLGGLVADRVIALLGVGEIARGGEDHLAPAARQNAGRGRMAPAWMITGWPCGERGTVNGPRDLKKRPL